MPSALRLRRDLDSEQPAEPSLRPPKHAVKVSTVGRLADAYARYAKATYLKGGKPTKTASTIARVRDLIHLVGMGATPIQDFDGPWLMNFRAKLAADPSMRVSRSTINDYAAVIRMMAKWAMIWHLIEPQVVAMLAAVPPLRKGRAPMPGVAPPPECRRRRPEAPAAWISATRPHLSRTLRGMIALQTLTAMRPGEVCAIRPADLRAGRHQGVLVYRVPDLANKLDHLDDAEPREVLLGPRAQRVLRAFWPESPEDHFFSPARTERNRRQERRQGPTWPSHDPDLRAARKLMRARKAHRNQRLPGEHYTPGSYARAIRRGALAAAKLEQQLCIPAELRTGVWSPYQLRHRGASTLAEAGVPLEVLQQIMGHADLATTMRYVHVREKHASRAVAASG